MSVPARALPVHGVPILRGGVMVRHNSPVLMSSNYPIAVSTRPCYFIFFNMHVQINALVLFYLIGKIKVFFVLE